jgi:protein O-mannosyl-transferase
VSAADRTTQKDRSGWPIPACAAFIAAAAAGAYSRTFSVPLLFDDMGSISDNPTLRHLAGSFWTPAGETVSGRPFLNFSLALDYAVGGTAVWTYHATNLLIHVLAALTLFGIIRRTLAPRGEADTRAIAFCGALLWALHPLLTESVTYIIQRAESLMGLFYLLTLYCFIRGAGAAGLGNRAWYGLSVAACFLGMGTKEVMATAPVVVLLYDRTFLAGSFSEAWRRRRKVYAGFAATWVFLVFLVLSTHGRAGTAGLGSGVSWESYALDQFPAIIHYLRLCFWPHPLVFDYGTARAHGFSQTAPGMVAVAALLAATAWALLRKPALGFLGAAFFLILAPSSSVIPIATEAMAEHRMYLPLIPLIVLLVAGIRSWLGRAAVPLCLVLGAALFCGTWQRNETYRSAEAIWGDAVARLPGNDRAHSNLGDAYEAAGRADDTLAERNEALRLAPDSATVHNDMGKTLAAVPGRLNEAIAQFGEALRLKPDFPEADNNLGNALAGAGRFPEAVARFEDALRLKPDFAAAHGNLGNALARMPGRLEDAVTQYREALLLNPDYATAHNNLGLALAREPGRLDEAILQFQDALRLSPGFVMAHANLGNALARTPGRLGEAAAQFEDALRLRPDIAAIHVNLAVVLLEIPGRTGEAAAHLQAALQLQPDNAEARQILDRIGQGQH